MCLDMGLGKTFTSLALLKLWEPKQIVIVCTKSKLKKMNDDDDSWENMVQKYLDPNYKFTNTPNINDKIIVINYDLFWRRDMPKKATYIFDEIQNAKSSSSKRGKAAFNFTRKAERICMLSGDPFPQGWKDSYNIIRILLNENINKSWFEDNFFIFNPIEVIDGVKEIIGYKNTDILHKLVHDLGVWIKTEDVKDLPEKVFIDIPYQNCKEFYDIKNYDVLPKLNYACKFPSQKLIALRQLSSGILKNEDEYIILSNHKIDKLQELIHNTPEKIIIFYNFNGELKLLRENINLKTFEINGEKNEKEYFINYPKKSILLCQYQSASEAIDGLQKISNIIVCFSPPVSGNFWKQMIKRIHRIGQTKTCLYYLFKNDLETAIYQKLNSLEDFTEEAFKEWLK